MFINEDGDMTVKKLGIDEGGDPYIMYKTFQDDNWCITVFIEYGDGSTESYIEFY